MAPRTLRGISVDQIPSSTGTCSIFMLHNHQIMSADHFTLVPMTDDVLRRLDALAAQDRVTVTASAPILKHGQPLPDIAGYENSSPILTPTAPCMPPAKINGVTTEDERLARQTLNYDNNSISDNDIDDHYSDMPPGTSHPVDR